MTRLERMQQVVRWLLFNGVATTQGGLAEKAGYNPTSFSAVVAGLNPMSAKFVNRICALDESLRPQWVLTGEGTMREENRMRGTHRSTRGNQHVRMMPFYPELPASAGSEYMLTYDDLTDGVYIPGVKADAFFPVTGCSMMPTIAPGDMVGVVAVDRFDRIDPDAIYMVITRESERMLKHIQPTPEDDPEIILLSDNPQYAPFRRMKEDILKVFRVVYVGRKL